MLFAVGVDVSNGRSMVAVINAERKVVVKPYEVQHTSEGFSELEKKLKGLLKTSEDAIRIVMEYTGRYYESFAMTMHKLGFYVSVVNPLLIKKYFAGINVRKVKTDKADASKIARFALDRWYDLKQYTIMEKKRYELKTLNRQFELSTRMKTAATNNLIALLDQSYPDVNKCFTSPVQEDGRQKWVDYATTFWHVDCVTEHSQEDFVACYKEWCKQHKYNFSEGKAIKLYQEAGQKCPLVPKDELQEKLVQTMAAQLTVISATVETIRAEMNKLASQLPEYETVLSMTGVGESLGPQLIAEIGDLHAFPHQKSLVGFAGTDPIKDDSGNKVTESNPTSKRGSPHLRRTLFVLMKELLQTAPENDPVYQFIKKKQAEGKPYHVYMTAGMTKFLRIYYGKVRDGLKEKGLWDKPELNEANPD